MAQSDLPVGPFPTASDPEAYDRLRRRVLWSLPSGLYVLGSRAATRRNLMTINWVSQVATDPKLVAVSVEVAAVTHALVRDGGAFALSIVRRDDRALVRRFVKPLPESAPTDDGGNRSDAAGPGRSTDEGGPADLGGFALVPTTTGCPVLQVAGAWIDCAVRQHVPCGSHDVFIGEVVDCGGEPDGLEVLRMEDTRMNYGG